MVQGMLVAARPPVVWHPRAAAGRGCERSGPYFFVFGNSPRATCGRGERQRRRNSMREKQ